MKKYKRYSAGFKEQALVKVYSRGNNQTIQSVANELNINLTTLKAWMKQSEQDVNKPAPPKSKRPEDWSPEEHLAALQQSYSLLGEDLNTWCRERGVFIHQLEQWKTDFCSLGETGDQREEARILPHLRDFYQQLLIISTSYNFQFISNGTTDFFLSIIVLH